MASNSYRNVFLTNITTLPTNGTVTTGFAVGQIGIVDARTNLSTNLPNFPVTRSIQVVQGTPTKNLPDGVLYGDQSWRTPEIFPDSHFTRASALMSQKPQNMIVALGYDGVDPTKTMAPFVGKQVRVYLTMFGQPVDFLLGGTGNHPAELTETFDLDLGCEPFCTNTCGGTVDCNIVADSLIKLFNERKLPGGQMLSEYVQATKLTQCSAPSGVNTTTCTQYQVTIPSNASQSALGVIQAQYPGVPITQVSYNHPYATYQATYCPSGSPAAYQADTTPIIPNCTTCPAGYTFNAQLWIYTVNSTTSLATIKGNYGDSNAILLSNNGTNFVYEIHATTSTPVSPAFGTSDIVIFVGTEQSVCVLTGGGVTYSWSQTGTCTAATEVWTISISDPVCGGNLLTELQSIYGPTVAIAASGICSHQYSLLVQSNESCVSCGNQLYTFTAPQPFGTTWWTPPVIPAQAGEGSGCVCGVKFTSAYVARDRKECYFDDVSYEVEPIFLYVSSNNPDFRDYSTLCADLETFPVTLLQTAKYAQGFGSFVADQVKQSRFYFNDPWYHEPVVRDAFGYQLGVNLQGYYDQVILEFKGLREGATDVSGSGLSQFDYYEWSFYLPAGSSAPFIQALNAWLVSTGSQPTQI